MWNPSTCGCHCNKVCKVDEYLDLKKLFMLKTPICWIGISNLLNTTGTSFVDKRVTWEKSNCHTDNILSLIIYLSLVGISCLYYNACIG